MQSATAFTLFARFLRGEDIRPQLDYISGVGANTIRLFGQLDPARGWPAWADYKQPWTRPDFDDQFRACYDLIDTAYQLRTEFTVLTYPDDVSTQRAYLQRIYDLIAARPISHFVEVANEPDAQGIDALAAVTGVNRRGVLTAYGYYDLQKGDGWIDDQPDTHVYALATLDYVTTHTDRGDEWPRKAKDALELRVGWDTRDDATKPDDQRTCWRGVNKPIVLDEPIGVDETNQPGHRSNVVSDYAAYHGVSCLYGAGSNYFSQTLGIDGLVPPAGSIQEQTAFAVRDIWNTIPLDAMTGAYTHDGFPDLAVAWRVDQDGLRCYGSIVGSEQWDVPVRPIESWTPVGVNGYTAEPMGAAIRGVR